MTETTDKGDYCTISCESHNNIQVWYDDFVHFPDEDTKTLTAQGHSKLMEPELLVHTLKKKEVSNFTCLSQWPDRAGDTSKQKQNLGSTRSVNLKNI